MANKGIKTWVFLRMKQERDCGLEGPRVRLWWWKLNGWQKGQWGSERSKKPGERKLHPKQAIVFLNTEHSTAKNRKMKRGLKWLQGFMSGSLVSSETKMGKSIEEECLLDEKLGLWMYGEVEMVKLSSWLRVRCLSRGERHIWMARRACREVVGSV